MQDYEKLGVFYLGRRYDLAAKKALNDLVLYESKNLVTHGLVVGMTGSGKTGLCIDLIEEAAIDAIPAIVIDPKGDLSNLLLTFPELRGQDFRPWVNEDDAKRKGVSVEEFANQQAELWRKGLAAWGQDGERIKRLREAADFAVYTPGSSAGLQVSILKSFAAPPKEILENGELLRERVASTVAGLLQLAGIEADPVKSRETILLTNLVQNAWTKGRDLDIGGLIHEVQSPSMTRIGVLDVESFYPAKERFELSMQLNNLLASPNFASWMEGEALDVGRLLHTEAGKPRIAIFSIAHLGDAERMFFVTLLLNQVLGWMRTQSGTNSLRALLYMDEIFGYFPPVKNPPSKQPLLTLLKQARAFGVGVVLATQNPVDLDYKGLSNIGTWFLGRMQTDRDKARVLDGLEGAATGSGQKFDRAGMEQTLAGLGNRIFLLHSVHETQPLVFESRWAMSYLRGPLARDQIKILMAGRKSSRPTHAEGSAVPPEAAPAIASGEESTRPVLPPQVPQFFLPLRGQAGEGVTVVYQPRLLGTAQVRYALAKAKIDLQQDVRVVTEITEAAVPVDWDQAADFTPGTDDLEQKPAEDAVFAVCPPAAGQAKNYVRWSKDFVTWVHGNRRLSVYKSRALKLTSSPDEDERAFRIRLQQAAREERDAAVAKLRQKYAPKFASLEEKLRKAEAARDREASQAQQAHVDSAISFGSTILGALFGRKKISAGTVSKAATTARGVGRSMRQAGDVSRAEGNIAAIQQQLSDLDAQFQTEAAHLTSSLDPMTEELETLEIKPTKTNINVRLVALVWLPFQRDAAGSLSECF